MSPNSVALIGCVSPAVKPRLASALPAVTFCDSLADAELLVRRRDRAVLFVDPAARGVETEDVLRFRDRYPSVAMVVYTVLEPVPVLEVAKLARAGISDFVLCGFDDRRDHLERLVEEVALEGIATIDRLEPALSRLSPPLRRAVQDLFIRPKHYRSTLDLASAAGISSRAVFRHLKAAGFLSPRRLVASARVLRAHALLCGGGRSGQEVAARLGYRSVDQLSQHLTELGSCTATDIRRGNAPADFTSRVFGGLVRRPLPRRSQEFAFAE